METRELKEKIVPVLREFIVWFPREICNRRPGMTLACRSLETQPCPGESDFFGLKRDPDACGFTKSPRSFSRSGKSVELWREWHWRHLTIRGFKSFCQLLYIPLGQLQISTLAEPIRNHRYPFCSGDHLCELLYSPASACSNSGGKQGS